MAGPPWGFLDVYPEGVLSPGRVLGNRYRLADSPDIAVSLLDLGLACCAMEVGSAIQCGLLVPEPDTASRTTHAVLIISGTVTEVLAPAVLAAWHSLPEPRLAVSFGSCANTGGPYWDAPTVLKGVDQLIPVATYVPGCPPQPEALIAGLHQLVGHSMVTPNPAVKDSL
jgi:NADH-quinone oxidoreductase subunit B